MKRVFLETGQRFFENVLDWFQTGKEETDKDRRLDYSDYGILKSALDEFEIVVGDNNNPPVTHSINVKSGIAYDNVGERIEITSPIQPYDPSAPFSTSPDGKGGTVLTPQSTGSQNIVLTPNVMNYIWIDYLATRDTVEFTLQKVTNKKQYYKQTDGFQITVTLIDSPPTSSSLKLGSVNLTGGGVVSPSTISMLGRSYGGNKLKRTKIKAPKADRSDATTVYGAEFEGFLDDHIKAVGTGAVSPTNPHGLTTFDIGFDPEAAVEQHQQFLHTSGIQGNKASITSSLYLEIVPVTPGDDYVKIKPLLSNEVVNVNGILVDSLDIPNEVTILFSSDTDPAGSYYIYVDNNTKTVKRMANPYTYPPTSSGLVIWYVDWTPNPGIPPNGNITGSTDLRVFGTLSPANLQVPLRLEGGSESVPIYSFTSSTGSGMSFSSDILSLSKSGIGYIRMGDTYNDIYLTRHVRFEPGTHIGNMGIRRADDLSTGIYADNLYQLSFATNNSRKFVIDFDYLQSDFEHRFASGIKLNDGSVSSPSLTFSSDTNIGIYRIGVDQIGFTANGTKQLEINSSNVILYGAGTFALQTAANQILFSSGSVVAPGITFVGDTNTGIFRPSNEIIGFSTQGAERGRFQNTGFDVNGTINASGNYYEGGSVGITTGSIKPGAIHQIVQATPGGSAYTQTTVARSVIITLTENNPVLVVAHKLWSCNVGGVRWVDSQIYRNGTALNHTIDGENRNWTTGGMAKTGAHFVDYPGIGTWTYEYRTDRSDSNMLQEAVDMFAIELKR